MGYYPLETTPRGPRASDRSPTMSTNGTARAAICRAAPCQLATSDGAFPNQAFAYGPAAVGVQFHPEITYAQVHRWTGRHSTRPQIKGAREREEHMSGPHRARPQGAGLARRLPGAVGARAAAGRVIAGRRSEPPGRELRVARSQSGRPHEHQHQVHEERRRGDGERQGGPEVRVLGDGIGRLGEVGALLGGGGRPPDGVVRSEGVGPLASNGVDRARGLARGIGPGLRRLRRSSPAFGRCRRATAWRALPSGRTCPRPRRKPLAHHGGAEPVQLGKKPLGDERLISHRLSDSPIRGHPCTGKAGRRSRLCGPAGVRRLARSG